jgi:hypothetical protein
VNDVKNGTNGMMMIIRAKCFRADQVAGLETIMNLGKAKCFQTTPRRQLGNTYG